MGSRGEADWEMKAKRPRERTLQQEEQLTVVYILIKNGPVVHRASCVKIMKVRKGGERSKREGRKDKK